MADEPMRLVRESLLIVGASIYAWLIAVGPIDDSSPAVKIRAAGAALIFLILLIVPTRNYQAKTLLAWAAFGASLGFALVGLFGIGLLALVPFVLLIIYIVPLAPALDANMSWGGSILSGVLLIAMLPV